MPNDVRALLDTMKTELVKLKKADAPAVPPAPGAPDIVAALTSCGERIAALLGKLANGGTPPDGMPAELKAVAGTLITVANGGMSSGLANVTDNGPPTVIAANEKRDDAWIIKALAPEVEMNVTLNSAQDFMYGAMTLMREGKTEEAKAKITSVIGMLNAVGSGAAPAEGDAAMKNEAGVVDETKLVKVELNQEQFVKWSLEQLTKASKEDFAIAQKRVAHLAKAVDLASSFWDGERPSNPLTTGIEMIAYFAPESDGAKKGETTTTGDQSEKETPATSTPPDRNMHLDAYTSPHGGTPPPGAGGGIPTMTGADATNYAAFKADLAKLSTTVAAIGQKIAKQNSDDKFMWPMDLAVDEDEEKAKDARINKALTPTANEDSWGKDPWAQST